MTDKNDDHNRLPNSALKAFEEYPRIAASPDFNQRVLDRALAARIPSRLELFCDRLDEIFARPVLKLLGAASLGGVLAFVGLGAVLAVCGVSTPTGVSTPNSQHEPETVMAGTMFMRNRLALVPDVEFPFAMPREFFAPRRNTLNTPARREKTVKENSDNRSSSCPAALRSLV